MQGLGFPSWFITPEGDLVSAFSYNALNYNPYWGTRITVGGKAYTPEKWNDLLQQSSKNVVMPGNAPNDGGVSDAAKNLSTVKQPVVPQFVQPYQQTARGFGAFGERDIF